MASPSSGSGSSLFSIADLIPTVQAIVGSLAQRIQVGKPPPRMKLLQTQILVRHGDRTPITYTSESERQEWQGILGSNLPKDKDSFLWKNISVPGINIEPTSIPVTDDPNMPLRSMDHYAPVCAQLTPNGADDSEAFGVSLFEHYGKALDLNRHRVMVTSTNFRRTIQTAISIVTGLGLKDSMQPFALKVHADHSRDPFGCYTGCHQFSTWVKTSRQDESWLKRQREGNLTAIDDTLRPLFKKMDFYYSWTGVFDLLTTRAVHGLSLPANLKESDVKEVNSLFLWRWNHLYRTTNAVRFTAGPYVSTRVLARLDAAVRSASVEEDSAHDSVYHVKCPRMFIDVGHDTNIWAYVKALRRAGDRDLPLWPPYGSFVATELYEDTESKTSHDRFYCRVIFNNVVLRFPDVGCAPAIKWKDLSPEERRAADKQSFGSGLVPYATFVAAARGITADFGIPPAEDTEKDALTAQAIPRSSTVSWPVLLADAVPVPQSYWNKCREGLARGEDEPLFVDEAKGVTLPAHPPAEDNVTGETIKME